MFSFKNDGSFAGFTQKRIPEKIDAIIVGSGIAGLTAAALLAKTGKKVLVLEQHDQAGGCCHTFVEKGFEFDVGMYRPTETLEIRQISVGNYADSSYTSFFLVIISVVMFLLLHQ